jgi:asparagine N-glycosylation enzyme membrane subunit Stt3
MRPFATFALWFSSALLMTGVIWAAITVYALGGYEQSWGPHRMFFVIVAFSFLVSLVTLFLSALGAKLGGMSRHAPVWLPVILAVLSVIANFLLGQAMEAIGHPPSRAAAILWTLIVPTGIAFIVARKFRAPTGVPSNKSFERTREG